MATQAQLSLSKVDLKDINHCITELKSLGKPPALVKRVIEAVCILLGVKPARSKCKTTGRMYNDYWTSSQKLMGSNKDFAALLSSVNPSSIPAAAVKVVRVGYTSDPDFTPEQVKNQSKACAQLCRWVHAVVAACPEEAPPSPKPCENKPPSSHHSQPSYHQSPAASVHSPKRSQQGTPRASQQATPRASQQATPRASHHGTPVQSQHGTPMQSQRGTPRGSQAGAPASSHRGFTPIPRPKLGSTPPTPLSAMECEQEHLQQPKYDLPPRRTEQTLVFIRFRRDRYDAFRNSVVKSKSIISNYTGQFIGVAKEMTMISNGDGPSTDNNITVGVLCFQRLDKCKLWAVSDTNMRQQDWLDGVDQIAVPLYEPLEKGCVFQVCNLIVNDADDLYNRYLPALDAAVAKYGGNVIAKSPQNIKFKGMWEPHFVIVVQWKCDEEIDRFHMSDDNPPTNCNHGQVAQFQVAYDL